MPRTVRGPNSIVEADSESTPGGVGAIVDPSTHEPLAQGYGSYGKGYYGQGLYGGPMANTTLKRRPRLSNADLATKGFGSVFMFQNNLTDQQGLSLTLSSGSASYAQTMDERGLTLSGSQYLSLALNQSATGYRNPLSYPEGTMLVDFIPTWASSDSTQHYILDTSGSTNRLSLYKDTSNILYFQIVDSAGVSKSVSGSPTWPANVRVRILMDWDVSGTLRLWYGGWSEPFTQLTDEAGGGDGELRSLPTTLYVGTENDETDSARGTYDTLAIFTRIFPRPDNLLANYLPHCEGLVPDEWPVEPNRTLAVGAQSPADDEVIETP